MKSGELYGQQVRPEARAIGSMASYGILGSLMGAPIGASAAAASAKPGEKALAKFLLKGGAKGAALGALLGLPIGYMNRNYKPSAYRKNVDDPYEKWDDMK